MSYFQAFFLAIIQGFTEFLPISSSAHLIFIPEIFGWKDQGTAFDVVLHLGTLSAVLIYYRQDIKIIIKQFFNQIIEKKYQPNNLGNLIIIATIPAGLFGLLSHKLIEQYSRNSLVIATTTLIFGILLGLSAIYSKKTKDLTSLSIKYALIIGIFQAMALIPGTSRSGITLTAGLLLGFTQQSSARFSFLISIPIIILSGLLEIKNLISQPSSLDIMPLLIGFITSAIAGYLCIYWFIKLLNKISLLPYVIYRIILAIFLFYFVS